MRLFLFVYVLGVFIVKKLPVLPSVVSLTTGPFFTAARIRARLSLSSFLHLTLFFAACAADVDFFHYLANVKW